MLSLLRIRLWWEDAFWVMPLFGVVFAAALDYASLPLDEAIFAAAGDERLISPAAGVTLFASIGGGMVTFTGFVFSVVLLVLQFGSSQYSPRTVSYFLRARTIQSVLAVFLATIAFSFLSLLEMGSYGRKDFVPIGSLIISVFMLLLSLAAFLLLLHVVGKRIRVDQVLTDLGRRARHRLRDRAKAADERGAQVLPSLPSPPEDAVVIRYAGRPGQIVAVDARHLMRVVARHGCRVILLLRIGDAVVNGAAVALVTGSRPTDRQLSRCLLVAAERSLRDDPLYSLRILTDISLKALSPAINDPTTAVRSIDEVEGVLRTAADLPLGPIEIPAGEGSLVLPAPSWSDIVDLALMEVSDAGINQPQVTRRLTALLNDLLAELPPERHRPLLRYLKRIETGVLERLPNEYHAIALTGDRQGIGGSRWSPTDIG